jgi:hypothetical protein
MRLFCFIAFLFSVFPSSAQVVELTAVDTSSYQLSFLEESCIPFEHPTSSMPHEECKVQSLDSLFTSTQSASWFAASYRVKGSSNKPEVQDDNYPVLILFQKTRKQDGLVANFAIAGSFKSVEWSLEPQVGISDEGRLMKVTSNMLGPVELYQYYLFSEGIWNKVEGKSWKDRLADFLPEGYYPFPIMEVDVHNLSASTEVLDREWHGPGDQLEDAKRLGEVKLKLSIEDQEFVIDEFCFSRNRSE